MHKLSENYFEYFYFGFQLWKPILTWKKCYLPHLTLYELLYQGLVYFSFAIHHLVLTVHRGFFGMSDAAKSAKWGMPFKIKHWQMILTEGKQWQ